MLQYCFWHRLTFKSNEVFDQKNAKENLERKRKQFVAFDNMLGGGEGRGVYELQLQPYEEKKHLKNSLL